MVVEVENRLSVFFMVSAVVGTDNMRYTIFSTDGQSHSNGCTVFNLGLFQVLFQYLCLQEYTNFRKKNKLNVIEA